MSDEFSTALERSRRTISAIMEFLMTGIVDSETATDEAREVIAYLSEDASPLMRMRRAGPALQDYLDARVTTLRQPIAWADTLPLDETPHPDPTP